MKRILLAIITEADICSASFCSSLTESVKVGFANNIEYFPVFFPSNGNWSMAFNQAVTIAWREQLDGFVCISPRVSWAPFHLIDLVNTGKDAVALPVATKNGFDIQLGEIARLQQDTESGEVKVRNASLDFIYLSTYGIDRLYQTHPLVNYRGSEVKLIIQSGDIYNAYFDPSEILAYRLREQGIEMWVNRKHTAYRQDSIEYRNNFDELLQDLEANG